MDRVVAYQGAYGRIRELVGPDGEGVEVPTCPGWTVKDVVAHLGSFFAVAGSDDPRAAFSQGWGDREVEARRDRSLDECFEEWKQLLDDSVVLFESQLGAVAVSDVLAHEQDLRTALDKPGARDDENIVPSVEMGLAFLDNKVKGAELPALRVVTADIDRQVGDGEPGATLRTSTFELFRALHGRRTVDQVRALDWGGDPSPWMEVFFLFGPAQRIVEG